jgi:hypothetical protein
LVVEGSALVVRESPALQAPGWLGRYLVRFKPFRDFLRIKLDRAKDTVMRYLALLRQTIYMLT